MIDEKRQHFNSKRVGRGAAASATFPGRKFQVQVQKPIGRVDSVLLRQAPKF